MFWKMFWNRVRVLVIFRIVINVREMLFSVTSQGHAQVRVRVGVNGQGQDQGHGARIKVRVT